MKKILKLSYFIIVFAVVLLAKTTFADEPPIDNYCDRLYDLSNCRLCQFTGPEKFYACFVTTDPWCLP